VSVVLTKVYQELRYGRSTEGFQVLYLADDSREKERSVKEDCR